MTVAEQLAHRLEQAKNQPPSSQQLAELTNTRPERLRKSPEHIEQPPER